MIKLDGRTLASFGLQAIGEHEYPILPPTIDRFMAIPGRAGVWDFGSDFGPRPFDFGLGWAKELSQTALIQKQIAFAGFLLDPITNRPRLIEIEFDNNPGFKIFARYSGDLVPQRILRHAFFRLPMIAPDPYFLSIDHVWFQGGASGGGGGGIWTSNLTIDGNTKVYPHEIVIFNDETGPFVSRFSRLKIQFNTGGPFIQYNSNPPNLIGGIKSDITINCQDKTVKADNGTSLLSNCSFGPDGEFPYFIPGASSVIISGLNVIEWTVRITWKEKFI